MELTYFINLILILCLNVLFFFSGICLNTVVILSFWRSAQLRKKLCYFMIMISSCFDLLVVLTNHPYVVLTAVLWLTGKFMDTVPSWAYMCSRLIKIFPGVSLLALLVMNFDRYLATSYPIFHRTSVTKRRLLTLLAILIIIGITCAQMSVNIISHETVIAIFLIILFPPMLFMNYKLFIVARKSRRNDRMSPEIKKTFSFKTVSSSSLAVVCFVVLYIPTFVYIGLRTNSRYSSTLDNAYIVGLWATTIASMNSTFNCLIFYWKNKILRTEGMKVIKGLKIRRKVPS